MPFTKGMTPWNKGKKTRIVPKTAFKKGEHRSVATEFKKGEPSWNKGKHIYTGGGMKKGMVREKCIAWKGGVTHTSQGYLDERTKPYKHRLQHRIVMEKYLSRKLNKFELVHHKDGNKTNNNIENLEVMSITEHNLIHKI